jgi:hypothetical protein
MDVGIMGAGQIGNSPAPKFIRPTQLSTVKNLVNALDGTIYVKTLKWLKFLGN